MPPARRNPEKDTLAGAAGERVRVIIEAAEASAAAIRAEAESEADRIRERAKERASELRSEVRSDVQGLIASIRDGMDRLRSDLEALEQRLDEAGPRSARQPEAVAAPGPEDDAELALAEDAAVDLDETEAADLEGARLVALNMALDGAPREEVGRHLREQYGVAEPGNLLDEVYESIGRS